MSQLEIDQISTFAEEPTQSSQTMLPLTTETALSIDTRAIPAQKPPRDASIAPLTPCLADLLNDRIVRAQEKLYDTDRRVRWPCDTHHGKRHIRQLESVRQQHYSALKHQHKFNTVTIDFANYLLLVSSMPLWDVSEEMAARRRLASDLQQDYTSYRQYLQFMQQKEQMEHVLGKTAWDIYGAANIYYQTTLSASVLGKGPVPVPLLPGEQPHPFVWSTLDTIVDGIAAAPSIVQLVTPNPPPHKEPPPLSVSDSIQSKDAIHASSVQLKYSSSTQLKNSSAARVTMEQQVQTEPFLMKPPYPPSVTIIPTPANIPLKRNTRRSLPASHLTTTTSTSAGTTHPIKPTPTTQRKRRRTLVDSSSDSDSYFEDVPAKGQGRTRGNRTDENRPPRSAVSSNRATRSTRRAV